MGSLLGVAKGAMIVIMLLVAGFGILLIVFDGKIDKIKGLKNKTGKIKGKNNKPKNSKEKDEKSEKKDDINFGSTQDFLEFEDIATYSTDNPIGLIVRNEGKEFVGVLEVQGINYNLLSIQEREILEDSFTKLLNGIDYPIQIYIQSRRIDIENYKNKYEARLEEIKDNIEKMSNKLQFLLDTAEDFKVVDDLEKDIIRLQNQYNYGLQIKEYIMAKSKEKSMIDRRYYIVISHKHNSLKFNEELTQEELVSNAFFDICNKASSLISALQRAKLGGKILTNVEIAELLYIAYNREDSEHLKIRNALAAKFSHYCTTSVPLEIKSIKRQINDIDDSIETLEKEKVGA